uniref:Uncharacterized protein n=1 Tax=Panagrolaimus sp. PS1159 TaxID=55785 RepID=A0AC35G4T7_9BILA
MSGSKWNFWKFKYDHDYIMKKVAEVESFDDLERLINEKINLETDRFALFREGIEPRYENSQNIHAFTWINNQDDEAYFRYFKMFWKHQFFSFSFVNGIYCSPYKISTWTSECETQDFRNKLAKQNFPSRIYNISLLSYELKLSRRWIISYFDNKQFTIPLRQRFLDHGYPRRYSTDWLEKIIKVIYEHFHFTEFERGIILSPSNLPEEHWRRPDKENRFVYCSVKSTLKEANQILPKFAANLAYVLYPRIPTIFLAFAYFVDGNLQIGVYLSGLLKRRIQLTQNNENAFDMSCHVAYKIGVYLSGLLKRRLPLTHNNENAFDMSCHVAYKVKEILANV